MDYYLAIGTWALFYVLRKAGVSVTFACQAFPFQRCFFLKVFFCAGKIYLGWVKQNRVSLNTRWIGYCVTIQFWRNRDYKDTGVEGTARGPLLPESKSLCFFWMIYSLVFKDLRLDCAFFFCPTQPVPSILYHYFYNKDCLNVKQIFLVAI